MFQSDEKLTLSSAIQIIQGKIKSRDNKTGKKRKKYLLEVPTMLFTSENGRIKQYFVTNLEQTTASTISNLLLNTQHNCKGTDY